MPRDRGAAYRRSVHKRAVAILVVCLVILFLATPVLAQGRDPFRAPGGAGTDSGSAPSAPDDGGQVVAPPSSGGLPRTGVDLVSPVVAAVLLLVAGAAMRIAARALAL